MQKTVTGTHAALNAAQCLQEGHFTVALERFMTTMNIQGYQPDLAYSVALCHYQQKQYSNALKFIAEIIDRGIKDHPGTMYASHMPN